MLREQRVFIDLMTFYDVAFTLMKIPEFYPLIQTLLHFFSMKRSRLSLNRDSCDKAHYDRNEVVEITDDESSDSSFNVPEKTQQDKYPSVENCGTIVPNDMAHVSSVKPSVRNTLQEQQQQQHDLSDDTSSNEDVIINKVPTTSNKSKSMFNWDKTNLPSNIQNNLFLKNDTLHGSKIDEPEGACNKRQKIDDTPEDDIVDSKEFKKEASPPKVMIQYEKMIGGVKVKFPVNPYSCQIGIVNSVNITII